MKYIYSYILQLYQQSHYLQISIKISNGPEAWTIKKKKYLNLKEKFVFNSFAPVSNIPKKENVLLPWLNTTNFISTILIHRYQYLSQNATINNFPYQQLKSAWKKTIKCRLINLETMLSQIICVCIWTGYLLQYNAKAAESVL